MQERVDEGMRGIALLFEERHLGLALVSKLDLLL